MKYFFELVTICLVASNLNAQNISSTQSLESLLVTGIIYGDSVITSGTGFVIKSKTRYYLITNWHIATNKNAWNGSWLDSTKMLRPTQIHIKHRYSDYYLDTYGTIENLVNEKGEDEFIPFWYNGRLMDVVAIPLNDTSSTNLKLFPVDYHSTYEQYVIQPADLISAIGYPNGFYQSGVLPIWKTGTLASEIDLDQDGMPFIYVDMLGIGGMSGSPVYYITNTLRTKEGVLDISGRQMVFLGVLSHGFDKLQLSVVWKSTALKKAFDQLK